MRNPSACPIVIAARNRGVALVVVLSMLTLITALVVGFLCRAGFERASAANYGATMATRQIADTTVNIVQSQINQATTRGFGYVWASQPGAVRVFNPSGSLDKVYRLYSATSLTTSNAADLASDAPSNGDWVNAPAVWVDINAPSVPHSGSQSYTYPILDVRNPVGSGTVSIDGFALQNPPGTTAIQAAPMPVRWLYVLRGGQIIAPDPGANGKVVTFNQAVVQPTKDNPIIGRTAFWTDDESCKINVNTAGDGTFWDTPHFSATDEINRAKYQPSAGEFQSYPGHPATTTLKPLFSALGIDTSVTAAGSTSGLFRILPRYNDDYGSKLGKTMPSQTPSPKTDRLYSGPGEILFTPARDQSGVTRAQLEAAKFFVTTHSRAPELNLFGQPRIATWPVSSKDDTDHRTPVDRLIAFCSTIKGLPYYFARTDSRSPTTDISTIPRNNDLLNYLDHLTSLNVPGVGGSFDLKYGASERRQILTEIFDYIRCMNLQDSTLLDANQYATRDPATNPGQNYGLGQVVPSKMASWKTQGFGRFCRPTEFSMIFVGVGAGAGATSSGTATPVLAAQASVVGYTGSLGNRIPANNTIAVQAFLVMNVFDPSHGWSPHYPCFRVEVSGLDGFKLSNQSLGFSGTGNFVTKLNVPPLHSRAYGGAMDWRNTLGNYKLSQNLGSYNFYSKIIEVPTSGGTMKLKGGALTVKLFDNNSDLITTGTVNFASPNYDKDGNILEVSLPVPSLANHRLIGVGDINNAPATNASPDVVDRFGKGVLNDNDYYKTLVEPSDVVYGVILGANVGDYRLLARDNVPSTYFVSHPSVGATGTSRGYGWDGYVKDFANYQRGTLLPGSVSVNRQPLVPATVKGAYVGGTSTIPGDWDNGFATCLDGPYINKPDEGTLYKANANSVPYFTTDYGYAELGGTFFSANRQVPSAVMFGSLPTGVISEKPWQTLLFRPGPKDHPGSATPKDHYLLDLFWMPVVEPYAISEPFSTAGKVNLNYQIVPFTYIKRNTALRAVLSSEQVAVVGKMPGTYARSVTGSARLGLNLDETNGTLRQFTERFTNNELFRSATEICDIYLVPSNKTWASDDAARADWYSDAFQFVGDNTRERPYANIYPRVTTKSSVFRVYYNTQSLQNTSANPAVWNEDKGSITGEYRGSTTIERYLNPAATGIPDAATALDTNSLEGSYRWRVVEHSQFAP